MATTTGQTIVQGLDTIWTQGGSSGDIAAGMRNLAAASMPQPYDLSPEWRTGLYVASKYVDDIQKKADKFQKTIKAIVALIILLIIAVIITTGITAGRVNHFWKKYQGILPGVPTPPENGGNVGNPTINPNFSTGP